MRNAAELARILKVLSVPKRVEIVQLLKERTLCVNALAERLKITQGAVSQHLRVMRDAGVVVDERRGYYVHYRLNKQTLATWRQEVDALLGPADGAGPNPPDIIKKEVSKCGSATDHRKTVGSRRS